MVVEVKCEVEVCLSAVPTEVTSDKVHPEETSEVAEVTSPETCSDKAQIWAVVHAEVTEVTQWAATTMTRKNENHDDHHHLSR